MRYLARELEDLDDCPVQITGHADDQYQLVTTAEAIAALPAWGGVTVNPATGWLRYDGTTRRIDLDPQESRALAALIRAAHTPQPAQSAAQLAAATGDPGDDIAGAVRVLAPKLE